MDHRRGADGSPADPATNPSDTPPSDAAAPNDPTTPSDTPPSATDANPTPTAQPSSSAPTPPTTSNPPVSAAGVATSPSLTSHSTQSPQESTAPQKATTFPDVIIYAGAGGAVILLALSVSLFAFILKRRRKAREAKGAYTPSLEEYTKSKPMLNALDATFEVNDWKSPDVKRKYLEKTPQRVVFRNSNGVWEEASFNEESAPKVRKGSVVTLAHREMMNAAARGEDVVISTVQGVPICGNSVVPSSHIPVEAKLSHSPGGGTYIFPNALGEINSPLDYLYSNSSAAVEPKKPSFAPPTVPNDHFLS